MKKPLTVCAAVAALAFAIYAASPAATQSWVIKYCADHGVTASTNANGIAYSYANGEGSVSFQILRPTAYALVADDCDETARLNGVTNGMRFAFHQPYAVFLNEPAQKRIWVDVNLATLEQTYVYNSWTGTVYGAKMWMTESPTNRHFRIYGTHITEGEAHSLTNGFAGGSL